MYNNKKLQKNNFLSFQIIIIMGIVSAIQNSCLSIEEDDRMIGFLDNNGKIINDDYTYFQQ